MRTTGPAFWGSSVVTAGPTPSLYGSSAGSSISKTVPYCCRLWISRSTCLGEGPTSAGTRSRSPAARQPRQRWRRSSRSRSMDRRPTPASSIASCKFPGELVITQSFVFEDRQAALSRMQMQQRRMVQTEDVAASQVGEIDQALDDAMSGHIAFGYHHLTVLCARTVAPRPRQGRGRRGGSAGRHRYRLRTRGPQSGSLVLGTATRQLPLHRAPSADQHGELRWIRLPPQLSGRNAIGQPLGTGCDAARDGIGHAVLLQLAPRRDGSHSGYRSDRCRQERRHELPARPERKVSAPCVLLRQGSRRGDLHSRAWRNLRRPGGRAGLGLQPFAAIRYARQSGIPRALAWVSASPLSAAR